MLPVLADALRRKPPRHVPRWLARLFAGEIAVVMGTDVRGASNAKARRELGWEPRYRSWREGFVVAYKPTAPAERRKPDPAAPAVKRRLERGSTARTYFPRRLLMAFDSAVTAASMHGSGRRP